MNNCRVGLALGAGCARGWAHIGVLRALNEAGIYPDIVAGTSIGAVVGGFIANALGFTGITGFDLYSILVSVAGAVIVLVVYHALTRRSSV